MASPCSPRSPLFIFLSFSARPHPRPRIPTYPCKLRSGATPGAQMSCRGVGHQKQDGTSGPDSLVHPCPVHMREMTGMGVGQFTEQRIPPRTHFPRPPPPQSIPHPGYIPSHGRYQAHTRDGQSRVATNISGHHLFGFGSGRRCRGG